MILSFFYYQFHCEPDVYPLPKAARDCIEPYQLHRPFVFQGYETRTFLKCLEQKRPSGITVCIADSAYIFTYVSTAERHRRLRFSLFAFEA